jgi:hypothetical protein
MPEPTPPPERPLSDQARARIRAELLEAAQDPGARARRWLVPGLAAASVVLVAGLAYAAIGLGDDDPAPSGPAGGGASFAPETDQSSAIPSDEPSDVPSAQTSVPSSVTPSATPEGTQVGTGSCETELEHVLKGAQQAYAVDAFSYWVKGDKYSVCFQLDGATTVTHQLPLTDLPSDDVATYRVASMFPPTQDGYRTVRVAGGPVPEGVMAFDVAYTFPDGHTERAVTGTDASGRSWWRMAYSYDDGGGNELDKPEIEVTMSLSGVQKHYTLQWALDTCAQANHGC